MAGEAIFIGYRRDDTADVAGRIYDALAARFGGERLFKDVDNIPPGVDFGEYIKTILPRCRVALILMGPHWIDSSDASGKRRLDDPKDWVRVEVETALATKGVLVVPALVNGAQMPAAEALPESLHPILRLNAAIIRRDPDFRDDVERLAMALRASVRSGFLDLTTIGGARKRARGSGGGNGLLVALGAIAALAALGFGGLKGYEFIQTAPALYALGKISEDDWSKVTLNAIKERVLKASSLDSLRAAAKSDARAQFVLGSLYDGNTPGLKQNTNEGLRLTRLSAENGFARAQNNLGRMYANGDGMERDYKEAARYYQLAANQGNGFGQENLGLAYLYGRGVTKDLAKSVKYFRLASDQGHLGGRCNLAVSYMEGAGVERNDAEAVKLLRSGAEQGDACAQANLARMTLSGRGGITADREEAIRLYRLAAAQNYKWAADQLRSLGVSATGDAPTTQGEEAKSVQAGAPNANSPLIGTNWIGKYTNGWGTGSDEIGFKFNADGTACNWRFGRWECDGSAANYLPLRWVDSGGKLTITTANRTSTFIGVVQGDSFSGSVSPPSTLGGETRTLQFVTARQ